MFYYIVYLGDTVLLRFTNYKSNILILSLSYDLVASVAISIASNYKLVIIEHDTNLIRFELMKIFQDAKVVYVFS